MSDNNNDNIRNRGPRPPRLEIPPRRISFSDSSSDGESPINESNTICDFQIRETNGMIHHYDSSDGLGCSTWLNRYLRENGITDVAKISFYFSGDSMAHSLILRRYDAEEVMFGIEFSSDDNDTQMEDYAALQRFIASSPNLDDRLGLRIRRPSFVA
jgi:hypothetical protein